MNYNLMLFATLDLDPHHINQTATISVTRCRMRSWSFLLRHETYPGLRLIRRAMASAVGVVGSNQRPSQMIRSSKDEEETTLVKQSMAASNGSPDCILERGMEILSLNKRALFLSFLARSLASP